MKFQWLKVLIWVLLFELFFGPLRDWASTGDFKDSLFGSFRDAHVTFLYLTYLIVVFLYAMTTYAVLYKFYPKRNFIKGVPLWIIAMLSIVLLRWILQEVVSLEIFGVGNYKEGTKWNYYLIDNLYYLIVFCFVGAVVYLIQYSKFAERQKNELIINNKKTELSFLKSQINPHFLFNSLNNLYSLVYQKSDDALDVVSKLSGMLRYSIYENEEKIPLSKELKYIEDFIELERLRNNFDLKLELNIEKGLENIQIAPFLLVPFIENAFKHGDLKNDASPIKIDLRRMGSDLIFETNNMKSLLEKDGVGGIGLTNVKKRLQLIYPERHGLEIKESEDQFSVQLKIDKIC